MKKSTIIAIGIAAVFVAVWCIFFLFDSDAPCTVTGWDALGQLSTGFWVLLILATGVAVALTIFLIRKYKAGFEVSNVTMLGVALIFFISTLKAYDVKANCGTTGTKGNPANKNPKDDGRVPAEELIELPGKKEPAGTSQ